MACSAVECRGDGLTAARLAAVTQRHARGKALTGAEEAAALTELAEVAGGRVDLLAQETSLAVGFPERDIEARVYLQIAQPCIKAGADTALIPRWIEGGRCRARRRSRVLAGCPAMGR